uniref:EF-hand domain-containing protein n=1 Tax=Paramoeba aestuarina TaxID=180227 RepID=A0A7S4JV89_9EUKA|mmetsp:Transcript_13376/g.20652  ORF Transcript_13376/g.20652 Transcript_13376/m.20652 type:complete len:345 (+) Transcript_13376:109-1143(+)|eukprot:CAMPEP_0201515894 /NCGR_PEP_ID=MMETSP0161_2-20130828/7349_1 /ASSEMBLY_ACC=CAM_ASM_000251 /TAXON_ID=180227 /ORGANISM="Neoparamoeba aestuarina, Strain SoJaBio B1-5/56/2" /LENGTH=344 /DNA_ID=CAMNT_0047912847 /DNA_START=132 /DNA_END=1166 /DNA_ORIENTATION=+
MGNGQAHEVDAYEESKGKKLHIMVSEQLKHETKFDTHQLNELYVQFAAENPAGTIRRDHFINHNMKLTNFGSEEFWGHVFELFDQDGNGEVTFVEWAVLLSLLQKGTISEKIKWLFHVFDKDNSGYLSADELEFIFSLICGFYPEAMEGMSPADFVQQLFETLDTDHDDKVTLREFAKGISKFPVLYDTFVILSELVGGNAEVVPSEEEEDGELLSPRGPAHRNRSASHHGHVRVRRDSSPFNHHPSEKKREVEEGEGLLVPRPKKYSSAGSSTEMGESKKPMKVSSVLVKRRLGNSQKDLLRDKPPPIIKKELSFEATPSPLFEGDGGFKGGFGSSSGVQNVP